MSVDIKRKRNKRKKNDFVSKIFFVFLGSVKKRIFSSGSKFFPLIVELCGNVENEEKM